RNREGNREEQDLIDAATGRSRTLGAVTSSLTGAPVRFEDAYGRGTTEVRYNGLGQVESVESPQERYDVSYEGTRWNSLSHTPLRAEIEDQRSVVNLTRDHACGLPTAQNVSVGDNSPEEVSIDYGSNDCGLPVAEQECEDVQAPFDLSGNTYAICHPKDGSCPKVVLLCNVFNHCWGTGCSCTVSEHYTFIGWGNECSNPFP